MSKGVLGSGVSRGQKLHALSIRKRPHADKPLANRGLLFCTVLGSLRQRASKHTRTQQRRSQPGNVLWERAKDSAATPSNPCAGLTSSKSTGSATAAAEPRVGPRAGLCSVSFRAWSCAPGLLAGHVLFNGKSAFPAVGSPPWRLWARGYGESGLSGAFSPLLVHACQRPSPSHWGMEKRLYSGPSCVRILGLLPLLTLSCILREQPSKMAPYVRPECSSVGLPKLVS